MIRTVSNNLNVNNSTIESSFYPVICMLWANMELGHKVLSFISQWNVCNFISQPSKLVIKLMVKMAFGNVGIILAGVCALNLLSLRRHGVSYPVKTTFRPVAVVPVSVSLCQSQAPLFSIIGLCCFSPAMVPVGFLYKVWECLTCWVFCSLCVNTVILSQKYFISQYEIWKGLCCVLQSAVILQFPVVIFWRWWCNWKSTDFGWIIC